MTRLPSEDRCGGDPIGLGFGGAERICNPLGFGSVVVGVDDGGVAAKTFRSMMAPPSGGSEALIWLVPEPPITKKGSTPFVQP
jgi:hypothetical protein